MEVGIELLAFGSKLLDPVPFQRRQHGALGQVNAFDQRLEARVPGRLGLGWYGVQRAAQIVRYRQHVAGEIRDRVGARVVHVARGAAAQVLHLGRDAQRAVLQLFIFLQQPNKRFIVAIDTAFRALGIGFGRLDFIGRAFVFCLVAHRRFPSFGLD